MGKGGRGTDGRIYPWGAKIDPSNANYDEAKRGGPTPVGSFPDGASPYGVLDMSGNVWEWTHSRFKSYPYRPDDGREDLSTADNVPRVVRGGSFNNTDWGVRAAARGRDVPSGRSVNFGFRVAIA